MGIFDIFTGRPAREAADSQRELYKFVDARGRGDIDAALAGATGAVQAGTQAGRGDLGLGFNTASGAVNAGADDALKLLDTGAAGSTSLFDDARAAYGPLTALGRKYGAGTNLYLDALGANGAAGNARAAAAFQAGPGYDFALRQGLDAINRRRNAAGLLASGNADRDATDYATELAKAAYGDWRTGLGGLVDPELSATSTAASGIGGLTANQAALADSAGRARAGIAAQRGTALADLAQRYGAGLAGLDSGEGNTLAGLLSNAANSKNAMALTLAQPYAKTYQDAAAAELAGSGNLWKLGMEGAKLAAGAMGGGAFGGGFGGGGLGGLFGGDPFDVNNGYVPFVDGGGIVASSRR